jgi:hypothetical protein
MGAAHVPILAIMSPSWGRQRRVEPHLLDQVDTMRLNPSAANTHGVDLIKRKRSAERSAAHARQLERSR